MAVVICDRDAVIACSGVPKKEYNDKPLSDRLEQIIENRSLYNYQQGGDKIPLISDAGDNPTHYISCAMPILSEGDIVGCVVALRDSTSSSLESNLGNDVETKLIQTAAGFLGRQLES